MPSFTRRTPARTGGARAFAPAEPEQPLASTSASASASTPASASTSFSLPSTISTGIGSLDDVLGAFPLGSTLLLAAPDAHTAWARLVARHAAAQGLREGAHVFVASVDPANWSAGIVWVADKGDEEEGKKEEGDAEKDNVPEADANERGYADRRIAWRYDALTFETTVGTTQLDASRTIPPAAAQRARASGQLVEIPFFGEENGVPCLHAIAAALDAAGPGPSGVARVILEIAPEHDLSSTALTRLLLSLRSILRPRAAVGIITLPARLSSRAPELAHAADAAIVLAGFGTAPLAAAYAPAHGLLTPLKLNARGHVIAPALRHSALLGVAAGSEQNLGFRLKRRRWVVESVHLGIEGGSGERRTEPVSRPVAATAAGPPVVSTAVEGIDTPPAPAPAPAPSKTIPAKEKKPRARVRFGEDEVMVSLDSGKPPVARGHDHGPLKAKMAPKVAIRHDRPDLYEF